MNEKWTDEELSALTDEERAALLEDAQDEQESDQEEQDTTLDADGQQDESEDTDDESDDDQEDESDQNETEGEQDDDDQAGGNTEEAPRQDTRAPLLDASEPEDAQERLEQITSQKDQLVQQFDDGELTAKEYQQQLDALAKREREIEQAQFKAKLAAEMQEQQARNQWLDTVNTFLDDNPTYRQSQLMYRTLDMAVRDLAQQEANAGLSGREILERAHQQIAEQFGMQEEQPATKVAKKASRKTIDAPPTLKQMPAADNNEITDTKWDKLDRLAQKDPMEYEAELAKMSDADRDAYLAAG